jgi:Rne/Rng family ribonuclease
MERVEPPSGENRPDAGAGEPGDAVEGGTSPDGRSGRKRRGRRRRGRRGGARASGSGAGASPRREQRAAGGASSAVEERGPPRGDEAPPRRRRRRRTRRHPNEAEASRAAPSPDGAPAIEAGAELEPPPVEPAATPPAAATAERARSAAVAVEADVETPPPLRPGGEIERVEAEEDVLGELVPEAAAPPPKKVEKVLVVNALDTEEVRIALLEDGKLEEIYVETNDEPSAMGNIYRGRVQNVERGIGAAFVDLGKGLTGFLHGSDLPDREPGKSVADLLQPGQELIVQITRDSIGRKGPALTARVALPGRYVVLMPNSPRSGVSRRIERGRERDQLRRTLADLPVPEGMGIIVRTAGESRSAEELKQDLQNLLAEWDSIQSRAKVQGPPGLLRAESDLAERSVRDILPGDVSRIVVDAPIIAERIAALLRGWHAPGAGEDGAPDGEPLPRVEVHRDPTPIFHAYDVETQLEDAFRRTIRLPSGGSIVIDPTEALVAIDVNSGRMTGQEHPEATALVTDHEAAVEVARQLRLRDLGGLLVVDFIDLRDRKAVRKVEKAFREALSRDRARLRLGRIGPFGCLMLSRQRIRPALSRVTHEECPACGGTGRRRNVAGLGLRVLREMQARVARSRGRGGLEVRVPEAVREWILRHRAHWLEDLQAACDGPVRLESERRLPPDGWAMKGLPPDPRVAAGRPPPPPDAGDAPEDAPPGDS